MRISPTYEDLALRLEVDLPAGGFRIDLLHSPAGDCQPLASALPYSEHQLPAVLAGLEQTIRSSSPADSLTGRDMSPPPRDGSAAIDPEKVGRKLYEALFPGAIGANLQRSLSHLYDRGATGLRLRLVLDPEQSGPLTAFPWELLFDDEIDEFFGRQLNTPIVRHLQVRRPSLTLPPLSKLRILVVLSNPIGPPQLNVEREQELIERALGKTPGIQLRFLDHPTGDRLRDRVRDEPFDVLHFVGHGGFDRSGEGVLYFEDDTRYPVPMTGRVVADTLRSFTPLRLVFLNACETAQLPRAQTGHDPYTGVAAALVISGVPAVIGMQFPISDRAALKFSDAFYRNVAAGDPLESAVAEGRKAIYRDPDTPWEWATPVLFLGLPNGNLFQPATPTEPAAPSTPPPQPPPAPAASGATDLAEALDILDHQRYEEAVTTLEKLKEAAPKDPDVSYYLALARLGGRRPRSARLDVIKRVEADLHRAHHLTEGEQGAHIYLLQALIKFDFYRYNGMRIQPPTIEELIAEARQAPADPEALRRLLVHAAPPPGPVRQAIEARLASA